MNHYFATLLFVGVLVLNHRLALSLTPLELGILATVLGVHQVTSLIKVLKAPTGTPEKPDAT